MDNNIKQKIDSLKINYGKSLNHKIVDINSAWTQYKDGFNEKDLSKLYRLIHNLQGSSGTYGYKKVANVAKELSWILSQFEKYSPTPMMLDAFEIHLENLFQCMKQEVNVIGATLEASNTIEESDEKLFYILVSTQIDEYLEEQNDSVAASCNQVKQIGFDEYSTIGSFGYETHFFHDISSLFQAIDSRKPDVLMIPIDRLTDELSGALQTFSQENSGSFIIVNAKEGYVANRLKAVRAGAKAYMIEPFTVEELLSKLDEFFKGKCVDYHILIVDDSPEVAEYYSLILQQAGMNVSVINEPLLIDQSLYSFNPDLILMDMYMPDCNGLEVAAIIRQQENYASIPIVFLSSEENREKQLKAMRLGVDDFISKSTRTDFLVLSIINRVERYRFLRSLIIKDSLTGVLNHTEIQKRLSVHLKEASRRNLPLCIVMIDLDHFKLINDNYGHQMGDRVLKNLCLMLKKRLRASDNIGRQGGEEFMLILPNTTLENARSIVDSLREQFAKINYVFEDTVFHVTFSAGVAAYPDYLNNNALIHAADLALYAAKKWGRNRVCLAGS